MSPISKVDSGERTRRPLMLRNAFLVAGALLIGIGAWVARTPCSELDCVGNGLAAAVLISAGIAGGPVLTLLVGFAATRRTREELS